MLTRITLKFLAKTHACADGVAWLRARPTLRGAEWSAVCAALEKDEQHRWSEWLRGTVARHGNAEDRKILRADKSEWVREIIAYYGTNADRAALRNDRSKWVREAVAEYGTAADREALMGDRQNDPH